MGTTTGGEPRAERRNGWFRLVLVAGPLAVVIALVAFGYRSYVVSREHYLTESHVRALSSLAEQTEGTLDALATAFGNVVDQGGQDCPQFTRQLELTSLRLASVESLAKLAPLDATGVGMPLSRTPVRIHAMPRLERLRQTRDWTDRVTAPVARPPRNQSADATLLFCRPPGAAAACAEERAADGGLCAEKDLSEIVRPYFYGSAITHLDIFIVDGSGRVLFENGSSGLRLAQLPLTPPPVAKPDDGGPPPAPGLPSVAEVRTATVIRTLDIDGASYRLIAQPLRIQEHGADTNDTWAIGVLVPAGGADSDGQRLPLTVLAGVPVLLTFGLLVLPFVKLATIGSREPLTAGTVLGLAAATLVGTALVCIAVLDWYAYRLLRTRFDVELRATASALQRNITEELSHAASALADFAALRRPTPLVAPAHAGGGGAAQYVRCTHLFADEPDCRGEPRRGAGATHNGVADAPALRLASTWSASLPSATHFARPPRAAAPTAVDAAFVTARTARTRFADYPWFKILALAGPDGMQSEKWTVAETTTPQISMASYSAFDDVRQQRLLRLGGHAAAVNVMTSPNTSETLNVISMPARDGHAAVMVTALHALERPLLPPDVEFAVLDPVGRVLFHSNPGLRLYENFFAELSDPLPLRSALFASQVGMLDVDYHGQPHRALVQPLPDLKWGLVLLHDKDLLRTVNAEAAFAALVLMCALVAVYFAWSAAARLLLGPGLSAALQPTPRALARYRLVLLPLALLGLWVVAMLSVSGPLAGELAAVLGALAALSSALLVFAPGCDVTTPRWAVGVLVLGLLFTAALRLSVLEAPLLVLLPLLGAAAGFCAVLAGWEPGWLGGVAVADGRLTRAYTAVLLALVVLLAVLPATALFREAYANHLDALLRTRQIRLAQDRVIRERRLAALRREAAGRIASPAALARLQRWLLPGAEGFRKAARSRLAATDSPAAAFPVWAPPPALASLCSDPDMRSPACADGSVDPGRERCRLLARGVSPLLFTALPTFTQEGVWIRHAHAVRGADCSWTVDAAGNVRLRPKWAGSAPVVVRPWQWSLTWPATVEARVVLALLAALALLALGLLLAWVVRVVSSLDLWETRPTDGTVERGRGEYWIRPTPLVAAQARARAAHWIDCETVPSPAALAAAVPGDAAGRVALVHFERDLDDTQWNDAKLALLEDLLLRRTMTVDVLSDVDVLAHFAQRLHSPSDAATSRSYVSESALARWARVLAALDKRHGDLPPPPLPARAGAAAVLLAECQWTPRLRGIRAAILEDPRWTALPPERLLDHIGDCADAHYRVLWSRLTDEERLVLYHLAASGFLNPRNRGLARPLLRSGLIRRTPVLRLMNESFRRFVRTAEARGTIRDWQRAGSNLWVWVRNGVLAVVILVAVVLFLTQPESYAKWAALLTALTTVGGGLTSLFGFFQARRGEG